MPARQSGTRCLMNLETMTVYIVLGVTQNYFTAKTFPTLMLTAPRRLDSSAHWQLEATA